jgi:hypothetical protein
MTTLHAVPDDDEGPRYNALDVAALAGVTYRCLDHWTRRGYLDDVRPEDARGSGRPRTYSAAELDTVRLVKHLLEAGFVLPTAFAIARRVIADDTYRVVVADVFELSVSVRDTSSEGAEPATPDAEEAPR